MSQPLRAVVVVALLVVAPVAATWWLADRPDELSGVTDPVEAVIVQPSVHLDDASQPVDLVLEWSAPASVTAPVGFAGFVTRVYVDPGDRVTGGDAVVQVDGIDRVAWHSAAPFYRPLARGAQGPDVEELHKLLMSFLSDLALDGDVYTRSTAAAVDVFAERLGAQEARGVFDPSWVIWLAGDDSVVGVSSMQAGQMAPSTGAVLWEEPSVLVSARIVRPGTHDELDVFDGSEWVVSVERTDLFGTKTPTIEQPEALMAIARVATPGAEAIGGSIRRDLPAEAMAVPVGAVQAGLDGGTCVWLSEDEGYRSVAVDVSGGGPGYVTVEGLDVDSDVLANPALVLDDPTCRS